MGPRARRTSASSAPSSVLGTVAATVYARPSSGARSFERGQGSRGVARRARRARRSRGASGGSGAPVQRGWERGCRGAGTTARRRASRSTRRTRSRVIDRGCASRDGGPHVCPPSGAVGAARLDELHDVPVGFGRAGSTAEQATVRRGLRLAGRGRRTTGRTGPPAQTRAGWSTLPNGPSPRSGNGQPTPARGGAPRPARLRAGVGLSRVLRRLGALCAHCLRKRRVNERASRTEQADASNPFSCPPSWRCPIA